MGGDGLPPGGEGVAAVFGHRRGQERGDAFGCYCIYHISYNIRSRLAAQGKSCSLF